MHGVTYDIAAPMEIYTLTWLGTGGEGTVLSRGQSGATAMVSGTLGLMIAKDLSLSGQARQLKKRLLCNANYFGNDIVSLGGLELDAFDAVTNGKLGQPRTYPTDCP